MAQVGRYRLERVIGRGGMGVVYAAYDPELNRSVALKLLQSSQGQGRLLREAQAMARLRHPNVVTVYDAGVSGERVFVTMELIEGSTLRAWLSSTPRSWREILNTYIAAGHGLTAAHRAGIVHRDFKPDNVLVGRDGSIRVADFGLARAGEILSGSDSRTEPGDAGGRAVQTAEGSLLGTPAYMAPEQYRSGSIGPAADQFAFAVALWEGLSGFRPFSDGTTSEIATAKQQFRLTAPPKNAPRWIVALLRRALQPAAENRHASMAVLVKALEQGLGRRRRTLVVGSGLGAGAIATTAIAVVAFRPTSSEQAAAHARARCEAAAGVVDAVWTADARRAYGDHDRIQPIDDELAWIDDYVQRWRGARLDACLAQPGVSQPRTETCLDAALDELRASIARTDIYWPALPSLEDCRAPPREPLTFPVTVGVGPQGVAVLSPDARRIAVSGLAGEPYIIAADPKAPRPEPIAGARLVGDWLPDGRILVQFADGRQVLRPTNSDLDQALPGKGDFLYTQINTIAPDGKRIAIADDAGVSVLAVPDGAILATVPGAAHELAWEPDGHRLAIVSRDLGALTFLDTQTGTVVQHRVGLHTRGLGEIGTAWLAPGRLAISDAIGATTTFGVYTLEIDAQSRIARAPELRYRPPTPQILRLFDAAAGHVLLHNASGRTRLLRWHADRIIEYPSSFRDVRIIALDRTRDLALGLSGDQLHLFDMNLGARTMIEADDATHAFGGLLDGRTFQTRQLAPLQWELVERTTAGEGSRIPFTWSDDDLTPMLRCAPSRPKHCVIFGRADQTLLYAHLRGDSVGEVHRITGVTGSIDVASDGKRLLAPFKDARVASIDIETGNVTIVAETKQPCTARNVREDSADPGLVWMVHLCADRFAIGQIRTDGGAYREIAASDGWISGLEVLADGDLVYSAMDWDPQLQILSGL